MSASGIGFWLSLALMSILGHVMPLVTRPDLFFGVTVDPSFRSGREAAHIVRRYRLALWSSALFAAALFTASHRPLAALLIYLLGVAAAQIRSHRMACAYAAAPNALLEVDLAAPAERIPGGAITLLLPLIALLGLAYFALAHIDQLPERLALHWGFEGPNRWVTTSPRTVVALLVQHGFACLIPAVLALGVLHGSRRVCTVGKPGLAERRFRRRAVWLLLTTEYLLVVPPVLTLLSAPPWAMRLWLAALLAAVIAFIVALLRTGQGGTRRAMSAAIVGDRTADAHWIAGMLYLNRADPALLVEKRMGIGWTLNFGNPWAWALLVAIVAIPAVLAHLLHR